jgi:ribosomal protein S1
LKDVLRDSAEKWEGEVPVGVSRAGAEARHSLASSDAALKRRSSPAHYASVRDAEHSLNQNVEERPFRAASTKKLDGASAPEPSWAGSHSTSLRAGPRHEDKATPWSKRRDHEPRPPQQDGPIPLEELHAIAEESSHSERRSDDAERELMEWKKAKFMQDRIGEDFDGLIISVTKFGFFVELADMFVEGLVPLSTLADDRYTYHENTREIIGQRSRKTYRMGQKVRVLVDRIAPVEKKIQFALLEEQIEKRQSEKRKAARGKSSAHRTRRSER